MASRSSGSWGDPGGGNTADCAQCGASVAADSAFCNSCGAKQQDRCAACGQMNPADSAFCGACGASLTADAADSDESEPLGWERRPLERETQPFSAECPRCHAVNEPNALFCFSCGLPMDEGEQVRRRLGASTIGPGLVPVGFWARLFALVVDIIAISIVAAIIDALTGASGTDILTDGWSGWGWLVGPIYYTVGVSVWSTTLGKRVIGAYVLRPDGSKVGPLRAFGRWLAYIPSALLLFGGFLIVAFRNDKLALHDMICDTVVVYRR